MNRRQLLISMASAVALRPLASFAHVIEPPFSFLIVGDWGTGGALQKRVAKGMMSVSKASGARFVLSTGDNIYPSGVSSASDPQWKTKYESIYQGLNLPWWSVLGNHDHRGNVDAQIAYAGTNKLWNMPGQTWSKQFDVSAVTKLTLVALDTTPIMQQADGWKDQLVWLDRTLSVTQGLRIVVGHHPIRSYGHYKDQAHLLKHVKPILDRHNVNLYCCGHDHDLQVIRNPEDRFTCLVSGGGGGSRETSKGAHSVLAHAGGGFALATVSKNGLAVTVYDADGSEKGRVDL
jgi:tartrate-resistant acid phosphatase type 5